MDDNKRFWEKTARLYTILQERSNGKVYAKVADLSKKYLTPESKVLELACGTGQFTVPLCGLVRSWEATDFSPRMIEAAQKRGIPGAHFSVQDATALPYEDGQFDVVLIANALHIMPRPDLAMGEILRVLRPGGVLLAPTFVYEGKGNRFRMWLTFKMGFKVFHEWDMPALTDYLTGAGFKLIESLRIPADPLPEGFFAARKP